MTITAPARLDRFLEAAQVEIRLLELGLEQAIERGDHVSYLLLEDDLRDALHIVQRLQGKTH